MQAFSSSPDAWTSCSVEPALMPSPTPCEDARVADRTLVAGRNSVEASLQLGPAKVGAAAQPRPATHHPAKLADPRIGLPAWRRLRQASAPRCDPNQLSKVSGTSRRSREVSCNMSPLTRLPWPCALLLARKLAALAIGSFPRGKHASRRS